MKGDMSSAAAVAASIRVVAELAMPVNVLAVLPLAGNLPGCGAYLPGAVLTMMNGTRVEVHFYRCRRTPSLGRRHCLGCQSKGWSRGG